ncbi:MAG: TIGR03936 family radical SAM-associated protein [Treponema sp.]|jgi:radical SAM-linked protein|nr:TIGR03936 family radical SAM-associated protein [Treponema sp.]
MKKNYIDPAETLGSLLLTVEKPGRYVGGEYGRLAKKDALLQTIIAFPDLYEIGMSNQALKIIYNRINAISGVSCDRAFAPAPDFENLLRRQGLPLYGLDTGIALRNADILMFTFGYELGITGVLGMMDLASIPIHCAERSQDDPVIIMGGPCVSNPLPYAAFIDAFWMGEAEAGFFDVVSELRDLKKNGTGRIGLLERLQNHPSVWVRGKGRAFRAINTRFGEDASAVFPVPSMKIVQSQGALEIMRGCPNGCRFCHAGFWYRPMRQKNAGAVLREAEVFISEGGFREISLSSLSSGDYKYIGDLVESLNRRCASRHVSFQLPSLRVSTFSLSLLEKISAVRRSGLTFAVETPEAAWQLSINKEVTLDSITAILKAARKNGWRGAKFYFMVGLPLGDPQFPSGDVSEETAIVDFIREAAHRTGMHFSINVGIFIPKPHTPYQNVPQMERKIAEQKLEYIRSRLKPLGHKVSVSDSLIAVIEGVMSRGDERAGAIIEDAYREGCRLDAWTEHIKKETWEEILIRHECAVKEILGAKDPAAPVPWECIKSGVSPNFIRGQAACSINREITSTCDKNCTHNCGICTEKCEIVKNTIHIEPECAAELPLPPEERNAGEIKTNTTGDPPVWKILFSFGKSGSAVFHGHLSLIEIFSMAFMRSNIPVQFTKGFNPLPKLEFSSPVSIGIFTEGEIAAIETVGYFPPEKFIHDLNARLPQGIEVKEAQGYVIPTGEKKHSLASLLWGYAYAADQTPPEGGLHVSLGYLSQNVDFIKASDEKKYRLSRKSGEASPYGLRRLSVLAKYPEKMSGTFFTAQEKGESYFTVYRNLYPNQK